MYKMSYAVLAVLVTVVVLISSPLRADGGLPAEEERDILIISTLLRFNDANRSGNYSVLRDLASKPFRDRNTVAMIADAFKAFRDRAVRMEEIILREIKPHEDGETFHDGILRLSGDIELSRFRATYQLRFLKEDDEWKLFGIDMDLR